MIHKQVLVPQRVRHPPRDGFSWVDRRFLREHAASLGHDAIVLYLFLAAVSDKDGLSYYGDAAIGGRLRMSEAAVIQARDELERFDLILFRSPLYQVLSLPEAERRRDPRPGASVQSLGDVLRALGSGGGGGGQP